MTASRRADDRIKWGKLHRAHMSRALDRAELDINLRMFLLATSRAVAGGHAVFAAGQIQQELPRLDRSSGELTSFHTTYLRRVLRRLVDAGLLSSPSKISRTGASCLLLPIHVYDVTARYRARPCPVHGHNLAYSSGWLDPESLEADLEQATSEVRFRPDLNLTSSPPGR